MANYLTSFDTLEDFNSGTKTRPNVSLITSTNEVKYLPLQSHLTGVSVGDIVVYRAETDSIHAIGQAVWNTTDYPLSAYTPIAVAVCQSGDTTDYVSLEYMSSAGTPSATGTGIKWSTESVSATSSDQTAWNGPENTKLIVDNFDIDNYPAFKQCVNYTAKGSGVGSWYMPAIAELTAAYANKDVINASFALLNAADSSICSKAMYGSGADVNNAQYLWASTEDSATYARLQRLDDGNVSLNSKAGLNTNFRVRAFARL